MSRSSRRKSGSRCESLRPASSRAALLVLASRVLHASLTHPCPTSPVLLAPHPQNTRALWRRLKADGPLAGRPGFIGSCHTATKVAWSTSHSSRSTRIRAHARIRPILHHIKALTLLLHLLFSQQVVVRRVGVVHRLAGIQRSLRVRVVIAMLRWLPSIDMLVRALWPRVSRRLLQVFLAAVVRLLMRGVRHCGDGVLRATQDESLACLAADCMKKQVFRLARSHVVQTMMNSVNHVLRPNASRPSRRARARTKGAIAILFRQKKWPPAPGPCSWRWAKGAREKIQFPKKRSVFAAQHFAPGPSFRP